MDEFLKRYKALNHAQKTAVDTIDGSLMVVAGPGTGKTELLSVRAANILSKTDALPQNILCLTFTDSGARAMRERLTSLIGNDANKVAIHTFHSFGSDIISNFGEYFYEGARFEAADQLRIYEVIAPILEALPPRSSLKSQLNDSYTYLHDITAALSHLKKGGLTPDELEQILNVNRTFHEWVQPHIAEAFSIAVSKKNFPIYRQLLDTLRSYKEKSPDIFHYQPLAEIYADSLEQAIDEAEAIDKTAPITAWKKMYITKDNSNQAVLKSAHSAAKLDELTKVYRNYIKELETAELYDFDDMIMRVVHALESHDELRFQLQETYQYIMVDEFQDTNDAQMRLVWNLTNSSQHQPNIMVVGDDDQAIYRFQGATLSNIIDFTQNYPDATVIALKDNYRSDAPILSLARSIIVQADERLETTLPQLNKELSPHHKAKQPVISHQFYKNVLSMRHHVAAKIVADYKKSSDTSRAIIARNHRQLKALLPHLQAAGIPLRYEHEENILENEAVSQLLLLARIISHLSRQQLDEANSLLPELLSHPAWGMSANDLWQISVQAYKQQVYWLEVMLLSEGRARQQAQWLIEAAALSLYEPAEQMLDHLFGGIQSNAPENDHQDDSQAFTELIDETYSSPLKDYFFPHELIETKPALYITHLGAMRTLRETIRSFRPRQKISLADAISCIDSHIELGLAIRSNSEVEHDVSAVTLLTAHKSKGLEFDEVYVLDATEEVWGSRARSQHSKLPFPPNLNLAPAGDTDDERLRLLYVALTRAKDSLHIVGAYENDNEKSQAPIGAIAETELTLSDQASDDAITQISAHHSDWRQLHHDAELATKEQILRPLLERYRLSATHLNNFVDVTIGGPQQFMLTNLLHFPQAMSSSASYGSAVHKTLQTAHQHFSAIGQLKPIEDVLGDFEQYLSNFRLSAHDFDQLLERGQQSLQIFFEQRYASFKPEQQVEHTFSQESISVGDARLTGAIDLIDIDKKAKTIRVTDYKTGKALSSWKGKTEFDKVKLHKYEQQLMFYKLLVENSRQFAGYTVSSAALEFVEPTPAGEIITLDYDYDDEKLSIFKDLIDAVWRRIMQLDFTLPADNYDKYHDIVAFEEHLRED